MLPLLLSSTRIVLADFKRCFLQSNPDLAALVEECLVLDPVQFLIDCSTMAPIISATQCEGEGLLFAIFKLTRNVLSLPS